MRWIYLSPHLDDAVFSCGGIIWEQVRSGMDVEIWTICAGDPPSGELTPFARSLHERWGSSAMPAQTRREEDKHAARLIGAEVMHMDWPDCIYRRLPNGTPVIAKEEDLWEPVHIEEMLLVETIARQLQILLTPEDNVVCPAGIGGHLDHRLTLAAAQKLGRVRYYYADFPYAMQAGSGRDQWIGRHWHPTIFNISHQGLTAWQNAVACYQSQISTFWTSLDQMSKALAIYLDQGGNRLWRDDEI